jgi:hypothetical protein
MIKHIKAGGRTNSLGLLNRVLMFLAHIGELLVNSTPISVVVLLGDELWLEKAKSVSLDTAGHMGYLGRIISNGKVECDPIHTVVTN